MVVCALPEMAEWWRKQGAKVEAAFSTTDYTYWKVSDAEDKDPRCKDPVYAGLLAREQFYLAGLVAKKFNPPLFFVRAGGMPANAKNLEGRIVVPVSQSREALSALFPESGISIGHCESAAEVRNFLMESVKTGANFIMYALAPGMVEHFETQNIVRLLNADVDRTAHPDEKV